MFCVLRIMFDMTRIYDYIIHLYYNFVNRKMI